MAERIDAGNLDERLEILALQEERSALLVKNGFAPDALEQHYTCPICHDTGFVNGRLCKCHQKLLKEIERDDIRRVAPIDKCNFDNFDIGCYPAEETQSGISPREKMKRICENCYRYAATFSLKSPSLLFMGATGLGKTHISLAIANVVINRGFHVVYGAAQNILGDLEDLRFGRVQNPRYRQEALLDADLLIIDDLGAERSTEFALEKVYNIVDSRYRARLPMILTTNLDLAAMKNVVDIRYSRIYDRIFEVCYPVKFTGSSFRKMEANRRFREMKEFLEG